MVYRYISAFFMLAVLVSSCGKDKLQTKPSIKIKSAGPGFVPNRGTYTLELEYADKEGDITDSLFVQKIRINSRFTPTLRNNFRLSMPAMPSYDRGTIYVTLDYQNHLISAESPPNLGGTPPVYEDDSLYIKFALRDKAGNISDTVTTPLVVVSRN